MLSAVVLTKNEEKNIERCLGSLDFCDEIIIVDDFSADKTLGKIQSSNFKVQTKPKIQIHQRDLRGDFAGQRNFGFEKAKGEWVLFIDADEEIGRELREEIVKLLNCYSRLDSAYYIKRRDRWWGTEIKYGEAAKVYNQGLIRLVKKNSGKWVGKVHEEFKTNLNAGKLNNYLDHHPHPTVKDFIEKINHYSTLRAKELKEGGVRSGILTIILYPFAKFICNYFIRLGFLDGPAGFTYAFMMSFHSFLVRAKLYQYTTDD